MTRDELKAFLAPLPDESILGLTLYGEARGEPIEGIIGVGNVIRNRSTDSKRRWGTSYRDVCLQPAQFSCWNPVTADANHDVVMRAAVKLIRKEATPELEEVAWVALGIARKALRDNTRGANHYHVSSMTPRPSWAMKWVPVVQIKNHLYYKIDPVK